MYIKKAICSKCGKKFPQDERDCESGDEICFRCALIELTKDDEFDQEPDGIDIENAWNWSRQLTPESLREIWEEERRYPEKADDE